MLPSLCHQPNSVYSVWSVVALRFPLCRPLLRYLGYLLVKSPPFRLPRIVSRWSGLSRLSRITHQRLTVCHPSRYRSQALNKKFRPPGVRPSPLPPGPIRRCVRSVRYRGCSACIGPVLFSYANGMPDRQTAGSPLTPPHPESGKPQFPRSQAHMLRFGDPLLRLCYAFVTL